MSDFSLICILSEAQVLCCGARVLRLSPLLKVSTSARLVFGVFTVAHLA